MSADEEAIHDLLAGLAGLGPNGVGEWRAHAKGVLRGILGHDHPAIEEIAMVRFTAGWGDSTAVDFQRGQQNSRGILNGVLSELKLRPKSLAPPSGEGPALPSDPRIVFVVHGRNLRLVADLYAFLRAIGLLPMPFSSAVTATNLGSPYIGDVLDAAFSQAQVILVLMTPDDEARLREHFHSPGDPPHETNLTPQPRANVIFEAGRALGRSRERTILVEVGTLRGLSDIDGLHTIRLSNDSVRRQELADRLRAAGCPVTFETTEWHTVGNLDLADGE